MFIQRTVTGILTSSPQLQLHKLYSWINRHYGQSPLGTPTNDRMVQDISCNVAKIGCLIAPELR